MARLATPGRRSVKEWEGKTPDSVPPPTVRLRVFDDKGGRCHRCTRLIHAGEKWTCEHLVAIINAPVGVNVNRESNLDVTCSNCLADKNAEDVAEKSIVYQKRKRHLGLHEPKRRGFDKRFRRRMDGTVERRT